MKASYIDIRKKIKEEPRWFDENGVPRYDKFSPDLSPNIYAEEVVLVEIACQNCEKRFFVEMNWSKYSSILRGSKGKSLKEIEKESFKERVKSWLKDKKCFPLHYGDPPHHNLGENRCVGETENCYDLRIVEFWRRKFEWRRLRRYEVELERIK